MNTPHKQPPGSVLPDVRHADLRQLSAPDQAWLAALAGLPQNPSTHPTDGEPAMTHTQALQLRQYFAQRDAHEDATPLPADSEARMLARLHRLGAFAPAGQATTTRTDARSGSPMPAQPQPMPTLGQRLAAVLDWLVPSGPGAGPRYALVAGMALAVMVVPVFFHQNTLEQDDGLRSTSRMSPHPGAATQLMLVPQPALQVQQLQAVLQPLGVLVQVQAQGQGFQLQASVPTAQQAAVQSALQTWGLVLPPQGALVVNVQPTGQP